MLRILMAVGLLLLAVASVAGEKQTIRWLVWEQVPNFILKGPLQGQGVADAWTRALQQRLPQYEHVNLVGNARRYHLQIREPDVCVAWAWIVPGSREFRLHSRPVSLAPRTGIQVLKSKRHLFGEPGTSLSLEKLLANTELKLGFLRGMVYSKRVHELLDEHSEQGNIYNSSVSAVEFKLKMLDHGRLDYFFSFSAQSIFDAESKGIANKYQFYNLDEMDRYTAMYSHCPKNAFGEEVMAEIDKVIDDDMLLDHLAKVERWYGVNHAYREVFMSHVIDRNDNVLVTDPGR